MEAVLKVVVATIFIKNWSGLDAIDGALWEKKQSKNKPNEEKKPLIWREGRTDVQALLSAEVPCAMKESFLKSLRAHT